MPTYGALLIFFGIESYVKYMYSYDGKKFFLLLILLLTFLLPSMLSLLLVYQKKISSLNMPGRRERILPFIFTSIFYLTSYFILSGFGLNKVIVALVLSATVTIILSFIITLFWKISAHMVGVAGLTGGIYSFASIFDLALENHIILLFLISGLVGFARLQLRQHNLNQVLAGAVLGFGVCVLVFRLSLNY